MIGCMSHTAPAVIGDHIWPTPIFIVRHTHITSFSTSLQSLINLYAQDQDPNLRTSSSTCPLPQSKPWKSSSQVQVNLGFIIQLDLFLLLTKLEYFLYIDNEKKVLRLNTLRDELETLESVSNFRPPIGLTFFCPLSLQLINISSDNICLLPAARSPTFAHISQELTGFFQWASILCCTCLFTTSCPHTRFTGSPICPEAACLLALYSGLK
jgi:hypothetical protein